MNRTPFVALAGLSLLLSGCSAKKAEVSLYCALDQEHSEALVAVFQQETGIPVHANYDTESNKTVGLVSQLVEEAAHPRCDVFWNNELAQTVRLGQKGLLQPYFAPSAA